MSDLFIIIFAVNVLKDRVARGIYNQDVKNLAIHLQTQYNLRGGLVTSLANGNIELADDVIFYAKTFI